MREDVKAARDKMSAKLGSGGEVKKLDNYLGQDERVLALAGGNYRGKMGLVTLTDKRLLFTAHSLGSRVTEDFPLSRISSIQWHRGVITGQMRVHTSGTEGVIESVQSDDGEALVNQARSLLAGPPPAAPPAPAAAPPAPGAGVPAYVGELRHLAMLRDEGVISVEDFEAKKAEILSRI